MRGRTFVFLPSRYALPLLSLHRENANLCARAEFLPGKRAFGIALFLYHVITSTILLQAPRFVPMSLGAAAES